MPHAQQEASITFYADGSALTHGPLATFHQRYIRYTEGLQAGAQGLMPAGIDRVEPNLVGKAQTAGKKKPSGLSAAGRKKISAAQKERWAEKKKLEATGGKKRPKEQATGAAA